MEQTTQPTKGTTEKWHTEKYSDCCLTIQCDGFREDKRGGYIAEIQWNRAAGGINEEDAANAALIAAAPELFQMVKDLKACIKRLTSDEPLSQYNKDTEAQWEGEAHELLTRINRNYYKNANELTF